MHLPGIWLHNINGNVRPVGSQSRGNPGHSPIAAVTPADFISLQWCRVEQRMHLHLNCALQPSTLSCWKRTPGTSSFHWTHPGVSPRQHISGGQHQCLGLHCTHPCMPHPRSPWITPPGWERLKARSCTEPSCQIESESVQCEYLGHQDTGFKLLYL